MNERALKVLEFDKIRATLSSFAQSDSGKALCLSLVPSSDLTEIQAMQQETEEAVVIITYIGQNPMQSFTDVSEYVHLTEKGATCSPCVIEFVETKAHLILVPFINSAAFLYQQDI